MKTAWAKARVIDASDRSYLEAALSLLRGARKEIVMSLYLIEPKDIAGAAHPVNQLMEALLAARRRSVAVRLVLNSSFRFRPKSDVATGLYFHRLLEAGAELTTLLPSRRLHDKLIVIDSRYVIEGSTNWSESALQYNYESASLIDSKPHAKKKLERIARLTLPPVPKIAARASDRPLLKLPDTLKIPAALFDQKILSQMVSSSENRGFDLYLILLGQAQAHKSQTLTVDLETLGRASGMPAEWSRAQIRRQVIKLLKKLESRYGVIQFKARFAKDCEVNVVDFPGTKITIPGKLLQADLLVKTPSPVTFLLLAGEVLKLEGSNIAEWSDPEIEKRFGISESTVQRARSTP